MLATYHIYKPSHPVETKQVDWPEQPGFKQINELVKPLLEGANLEHVTVLHNGKRADMFVDEVGALKRLPVNAEATAIYRANWMQQHPGTDPNSLPEIYGTAILFDRQVWF